MSYIELSNGSELYVISQGDAVASRVLVFVHGLGATHTTFEPLIEAGKFTSTHRVIVYDREGSGVSKINKTAGARTLQSHVDDLALLIETLGVPKVSIFGHSMGSFISAEYAIQNPDKVDKLVIAGTAQMPFSDGVRTMQRQWSAAVSTGGLVAISDIIVPVLTAPSASSISKALIRAMFLAQDPEGYVSGINILANAEKPIEFEKLGGKPVLVIGGSEDALGGDGGNIAALIPGAKHEIIAGSGHSFIVEDPEHVAGVLNKFLEQ